MKIRYDDKGKYFTETIHKQPTPAIIQAVEYRVHGTIHVDPSHRLVDELNEHAPFLAITDARIVTPEGELKTEFVTVNKRHVIWIIPQGGPGEDNGTGNER